MKERQGALNRLDGENVWWLGYVKKGWKMSSKDSWKAQFELSKSHFSGQSAS